MEPEREKARLTYDAIIIGGGAAGLMCAAVAGARGRQVLLLEGSNKVGKKILMSGGGRCNFTNLNTQPEHFISANPHFCKSALSRYSPDDFLQLVKRHDIAFHEKTVGQLFCDRSSKDIVAMLLAECATAGVEVRTNADVTHIVAGDSFNVRCAVGRISAPSLVIATGGLSIPKMGASDFGYRIARQFGHSIIETRAGLVPFTFSGPQQAMNEQLSGVSVAATLSAGETTFGDALLFTHRGLSGPAALQVSSFWSPGMTVEADLLPNDNATDALLAAKKQSPKSLLRSVLSDALPRALVLELQATLWPAHAETPIGALQDKTLRDLGEVLASWSLKPSGTEGYRTAEVTLGGVDTRDLSSSTMESKLQPRAYFIGEVVDVTGQLGGFNFQWAWASGWAAGQAI